jgi:hypothetical protein
LQDEFERDWLTGALLNVGAALMEADYFDHAPELELVYHLRNGIAHGNRFEIRNLDRLSKYPAHNRLAAVRSDLKTTFEVTPSLDDQPVLFDYMGSGDVLDLLMSVEIYLCRVADGLPGHA